MEKISSDKKLITLLNQLQNIFFYQDIIDLLSSQETDDITVDKIQEFIYNVSKIKKILKQPPQTNNKVNSIKLLQEASLAIKNIIDNHPKALLLDAEQKQIYDICAKIHKESSRELGNIQKNKTSNIAKLNIIETDEQDGTIFSLYQIIKKSISTKRDFILNKTQIKIIKTAMGTAKFNNLLEKYNLDLHGFTTEDLNMLIVGYAANMNLVDLRSPFSLTLYKVFKEQNSRKSLREIISHKQEFIDKINAISNYSSANISHKILNWVFHWAKRKYKSSTIWKSIVPNSFNKVNNAFENDLKVLLGLGEINKFTNKKHPKIQQYAGYEYIFHKLSSFSLENNTVIPAIEKNGEINNYLYKKILSKDNIDCFALIPMDYQNKNLDIKVVFKGTKSIPGMIIDTECYGAGYYTYQKHQPEIMLNFNKLIKELKAKNPDANLSLTVGGHSLGGALAQNFVSSVIGNKCINDGFTNIDDNKIKQQISNELLQQKNYKNLSHQEIKTKIEQEFTNRKNNFAEYIKNHQEIVNILNTKQLNCSNDIQNINLATINSAGIPHKLRKTTVDCINNLKNRLNLTAKVLMVGGDIVQQTGQTHLACYAHPSQIKTEICKFKGSEGIRNNIFKSIVSKTIIISAMVVAFKIISLTSIPIAPATIGLAYVGINLNEYLVGNKFKSFTKQITRECLGIVDQIKKSHTQYNFDKPKHDTSLEIINNKNNHKTINQELSGKVSIINSKHFQKFKEVINKILISLYNKNKKFSNTPDPAKIYLTDLGIRTSNINFTTKAQPIADRSTNKKLKIKKFRRHTLHRKLKN